MTEQERALRLQTVDALKGAAACIVAQAQELATVRKLADGVIELARRTIAQEEEQARILKAKIAGLQTDLEKARAAPAPSDVGPALLELAAAIRDAPAPTVHVEAPAVTVVTPEPRAKKLVVNSRDPVTGSVQEATLAPVSLD